MYSQEDLNSAVAAGVISADAATALRNYIATSRDTTPADAEHFRLITGFNDIFVSIGVVIMLVAMGAIGAALGGALVAEPATSMPYGEAYRAATTQHDGATFALASLFVAAISWGLAEFFTRKRRMALPSIILLLAFVGSVMATQIGLLMVVLSDGDVGKSTLGVILLAVAALITAGAAWVHWKRFMVPITIAAGTAALAATVILLLVAAIGPENDHLETIILALTFIAGLVIFGFAMRWDMSDTARATRRSDVAFWLHLLAAPMIAHPVFALIGVTGGVMMGLPAAVAVLVVYIFFGLVALAVDRRALLVSALAYVLIALGYLFSQFGAVELNFALTALVIGSALLTLSAMWAPIRKAVVSNLPGNFQARLPLTA